MATKFVHGGSPQAPGDWNRDQIQAGVTMLQPSAIAFRLSDALQKATYTTSSNAGDIAQIEADIATLQGQVQSLSTQMTTLQGQIGTLQGQMTVVQGFMNSFNWVQAEVSTGLIFLDQRTLYTRSFVISAALNTGFNVFVYPHGITAINYVAQAIGVAGINSSQTFPITYVNMTTAPTNIQDGISFYVDPTNIYVLNGAVIRTNFLVLVKLYYTCTDR